MAKKKAKSSGRPKRVRNKSDNPATSSKGSGRKKVSSSRSSVKKTGRKKSAAKVSTRKKRVNKNVLAKNKKDRTEEIRQRAYSYFLERGGEHGRDKEDWSRAEKEIIKN